MILYMYQIGDDEVVVSSQMMSLVVVLGNWIEIFSHDFHILDVDNHLHYFGDLKYGYTDHIGLPLYIGKMYIDLPSVI